MTISDSSSSASQDFVPKAKHYSRRGPVDLRKKVLRDQTCKNHLGFGSSSQDKPSSLLKLSLPGKENDLKEEKISKDNLPRLSCEEKTLKIRKKLERIIHKKESDHTKALEYLSSLDKMKYTQKVLDTTKICYTVEALKLVVKDKTIVDKADDTLVKIKASVAGAVENKVVRDSFNHLEVEEKETKHEDKKEIKTYTEWRDAKKEEDEQKKKDFEERKKKYTHDLQEYEKKKKEYERKQQEFNQKTKSRHEKKKTASESLTLKESIPNSENLDPTPETASKDEEAAGAEGYISSMRLGYWYDKLVSGVDQLSLLNRKVETIEDSVKTIDTKEEDDKKKRAAMKAHENAVQKGKDIFEDDLILITKNINKIDITETVKDKKSDSCKTVDKSELPVKPKLNLNIQEIKAVLDDHAKHDVTVVIKNLKTLSSLQISIETLQTTKIGISVNNLRKSTNNEEISDISKTILKSWKKLLPTENAVKVEKKELPAEEKNSTADIRKYCKEKILYALKSNDTLKDVCKIQTEKLAGEIEEEVFLMYKEANSKYRNQVNSRYFNILKNITLQENLLLGNLDPKAVARMSYEELASEQVKETRAKWTMESLESVKTVPDNHVAGDFCTCRICLPPWIKA